MNMISPIGTLAPGATPAPETREDGMSALHRFFDQLSPGSRPRELTRDTALLASGLLDSLGILQLTVFLSEEFGIEIGDEDFTIENFASIGTLLDFIAARRQA
jgi:acyl carrier protein